MYNNYDMFDKKSLKIVFMGTPSIAAKVFLDMINDGYNFVGLIAQEDKPVGRKKILMDVPTKVVAKEHNIPVYQPHKIRLDYEFVKELQPDLIITLAYGQIVPQGLLDIPTYGCLNLHGSILPKYRGAAPIQRAIEQGETRTGVTLMEMVDKMDAGRMYDFEYVDILEEDNYTSLRDKIADAASKLVLRSLPEYINGNLKGIPQNEDEVTFADKISKEDEKLSLMDIETFINKVRSLANEPGGYLLLEDKKFKVLECKRFDNETLKELGSLSFINKKLLLQLQDGQVELTKVQLEGKNVMSGKDFANGHKDVNTYILK